MSLLLLILVPPFFLLAPLFTTSIKQVVGADPSRACSSSQFACHDGTQCIPKSKVCNGDYKDGCADYSHTSAAQCNDCTDEHLFKCERHGKEVCNANKYKCDGIKHCDDRTDEIAAYCHNCTSNDLFKCRKDGKEFCRANKYKCDGHVNCDGAADELISTCGNCTSNQFACHDGKFCIPKSKMCNGRRSCADFSHTSAAQCDDCAGEDLF